jgi:enoyl-CoA hydratase/3-hydroxyacyl-CoA dehydrogenase
MAYEMYGRILRKIGVVGSGNIGPDIALYFSKVLHAHGVHVTVVDIAESALKSGKSRVKGKLARGVKTKTFRPEEVEAMLANISWTSDYSQLSGADLVVEAATEDKGIKQKIFSQLEKICDNSAIFASNSSHIEPEVIFEQMKNKERCLVIHYFFPAERSIIVEIVPGKDTSAGIADFLMKFYEQIGKAPIQVKSRYGYAIDPIFEGIFLSSVLMVEKGIGTVMQMDAMVQKALGLGVGPFTAMNLTGGNPIVKHGAAGLHEKVMPWFHCPHLLEAQIAIGKHWETSFKPHEVSYSESVYQKVSDQIKGAYFGLVCEVLDAGISTLGDLEMAVESALVIKPPFQMMNQMGVDKAYALVKNYAEEWPGFKVPEIMAKQAESGKPWPIPMVFRKDEDNVAILTIRRPSTLNALNAEVMAQLLAHFENIKDDENIKGVVLTGYGVKAFVSGADIGMLARVRTPKEGEEISLNGQKVLNFIESLGKPVVCALNGLAFGGGNELAMACSARVAKKGLKLLAGQPEPKLGIIPGYGGSQRLPRIIGLANAWPVLRTGNPISSSKALEWGLITEEVDGDIREAGVCFVKKVISGEIQLKPLKKDPLDIPESLPEVDIGQLSRKTDEILQKAILEGAAMTLDQGLRHEAKMFGECIRTKDMRIGMENFMNFGPKRNAKFSHS